MKQTILSHIAILAILLSTTSAKADFVFAFNESGTKQDFDVQSGQFIEIPIYLVQTGATTALTDIGLASIGVTVSYQSSATEFAVPQSASLSPQWDDDSSAGFNRINIDVADQSIVMEGGVANLNLPIKGNAIQLGTITFLAGEPDSITTLMTSLSSRNTFLINSLGDLPDFTTVSPLFEGGTIRSFSAVPEPSSAVLIAAISIGFAGRRLTRTVRRALNHSTAK